MAVRSSHPRLPIIALWNLNCSGMLRAGTGSWERRSPRPAWPGAGRSGVGPLDSSRSRASVLSLVQKSSNTPNAEIDPSPARCACLDEDTG